MVKKVDMFEYFANLSDMEVSLTEKGGRYKVMKEKEMNIFEDIKEKLNLYDKNNILDIGCGCGVLVNKTISYIQKENKQLYLNDSRKVLSQIIKATENNSNIQFIEGKFPDLDLEKNIKFDAIILYSIIHYIDKENIFTFLDSIIDRLESGGALLIGDIPNINKKKRFNNSQFGKLFNLEWEKNLKSCYTSDNYPVLDLSHFNDSLIIEIVKYIRSKETFNAYILPQSSNLPFSYIRDDILVKKV